jgi:hypothetical protein
LHTGFEEGLPGLLPLADGVYHRLALNALSAEKLVGHVESVAAGGGAEGAAARRDVLRGGARAAGPRGRRRRDRLRRRLGGASAAHKETPRPQARTLTAPPHGGTSVYHTSTQVNT